jgi:oxaloacetate decarboxylase alpha subunit
MDLKELRALLKLMEGSDLEELELEEAGKRIRLRRRGIPAAAGSLVPFMSAQTGAAPTMHGVPVPDTSGLLPIASPMVGTFYRAPAPDAPPYVTDGDVIAKGAVVCIVEAMKLMNEIESEVAGRIAKILVENGQPVEFGQTLFLVAPA